MRHQIGAPARNIGDARALSVAPVAIGPGRIHNRAGPRRDKGGFANIIGDLLSRRRKRQGGSTATDLRDAIFGHNKAKSRPAGCELHAVAGLCNLAIQMRHNFRTRAQRRQEPAQGSLIDARALTLPIDRAHDIAQRVIFIIDPQDQTQLIAGFERACEHQFRDLRNCTRHEGRVQKQRVLRILTARGRGCLRDIGILCRHKAQHPWRGESHINIQLISSRPDKAIHRSQGDIIACDICRRQTRDSEIGAVEISRIRQIDCVENTEQCRERHIPVFCKNAAHMQIEVLIEHNIAGPGIEAHPALSCFAAITAGFDFKRVCHRADRARGIKADIIGLDIDEIERNIVNDTACARVKIHIARRGENRANAHIALGLAKPDIV